MSSSFHLDIDYVQVILMHLQHMGVRISVFLLITGFCLAK